MATSQCFKRNYELILTSNQEGFFCSLQITCIEVEILSEFGGRFITFGVAKDCITAKKKKKKQSFSKCPNGKVKNQPETCLATQSQIYFFSCLFSLTAFCFFNDNTFVICACARLFISVLSPR